ncbi:unnamed protein product [Clavelina lepadiformis]|uniref:Uncharacterized protein n=1 Tax=Clavelina lepadiformis TaxID=159417 RepID=A0ABP0FDA3_CLALP
MYSTLRERDKNKRSPANSQHFSLSHPGDKFNQLYIPYNPAFKKTNILQHCLDGGEKVDDVAERQAKLVLLGRKNVKVNDVIGAIMCLASDRAKNDHGNMFIRRWCATLDRSLNSWLDQLFLHRCFL